MDRKSRSMVVLWTAAIDAQAAMWTTLAVRVPLLATGTMTADEQTRMVAEKVDAFAESARATSATLGRMMLNPTQMLQSPAALMDAMVSLSSVASKPYQKRLASNAKRLRKRKG